jgi:hypothetical protein
MTIIDKTGKLKFKLYHGTSSLFLNSIIENGLGGINPVKEMNLLELSQEIFALSTEYLHDTPIFRLSGESFKRMTEQTVAAWNFQHGDTYLTPFKDTACSYAINKRYGSEILSYTLNFIQELINKDINYVKSDLYLKYQKVFDLLKINPAPLLIEIQNIDAKSLLSEHGKSPDDNYVRISRIIKENPNDFPKYLGQTNFRIKESVNLNNLKIWFINVKKMNDLLPDYNLFELKLGNN